MKTLLAVGSVRRVVVHVAHYAQLHAWKWGVLKHLVRHPGHVLLLLGLGWAPVLFIAYALELARCKAALRWWLDVTGSLTAVRANGFDADGFDVV